MRGRVAHLMVRGYGTSRMTNVVVERRIGVSTNRALTVVEQVAERWC